MLEGLGISEIPLELLIKNNLSFRFDDIFFSKTNLKKIKKVQQKPHNYLINLSTLITDFGAFSQMNFVEYQEVGVPFLRNQNIKNNIVDTDDCVFIDALTYEKLSLKLDVNDVVIPRVGTLGGAAVISKENLPCTANQNLAQIKPNQEKLNSFFLSSFLCSDYGVSQVIRSATGNVQPWLNLENIGKIIVPVFDLDFQNNIEMLILNAKKHKAESTKAYQSAEQTLLEAVGLADFKPSTQNTNIKTFAQSFVTSGRLDAEYYQPKYEEVVKKIHQYGSVQLDKFIDNYSTGYPYSSDTYLDQGLPLIRINNIKNGNLDISGCSFLPEADIALSPKDLANPNDILISMSGSIGNCCKIPIGVKAVINQRIMRITPKNYDVDVLPLVINSMICQTQLERIGTGGVQTNISATDIKQIFIPNLDQETQTKISQLVQQSFNLKAQSENLLSVAKLAVEMAIEQDEAAAMQFIKTLNF